MYSNVLSENYDHLDGKTLSTIRRLRQNQETYEDLTGQVVGCTSTTVVINGYHYLQADYLQAVNGKTTSILQNAEGVLFLPHIVIDQPITVVEVNMLEPVDAPEESITSGYRFSPYKLFDVENVTSKVAKKLLAGGHHVPITEKVVGTTFRNQVSPDQLAGIIDNSGDVPKIQMLAVLTPEPTNPEDPNAVAVYVKVKNSAKAHHVGYLAKKGQLYHKIKSETAAKLQVVLWSQLPGKELTDSYIVTVE